jgi:hypothetical protein
VSMNNLTSCLRASSLALLLLASSPTTAQAQFHTARSLYQARSVCVPTPMPRYLPGHYETRSERIFIPGSAQRIYIPAQYSERCGLFGIRYRRMIQPARYEIHRQPGRYEIRQKRAWIPGRYVS